MSNKNKLGDIDTMKQWFGFALLVPVVLIFVSALSTPSAAQRGFDRQSGDRVCFYTDKNFRGDSFCANLGESRRNVGDRFNDQISSIRIFGRAEVTVFEDENFGGARRTYKRDIPNLLDWNDKITSFQVSMGERGGRSGDERRNREPQNGACFYVDENFGGQSLCLNSGENLPNVGEGFNDRISSIRIFGKARVIVYTDEGFRGRGQEFDRDVRNLGSLNDQITSVRVR